MCRILTASDYMLVLGMPGSGKTSTVVSAVQALMATGRSVLLTAYTNSAVDNLALKLLHSQARSQVTHHAFSIEPYNRGHHHSHTAA